METYTQANRTSRTRDMSPKDFSRLSQLIHSECGIKMPPSKKTMLELRLQRRMRLLGLQSVREYCDYLFSHDGYENELIHMIDVVTTNKTDFFREPAHFDYLVKTALHNLMHETAAGVRRKLVVWSAGCSTGEEPYTIAMVLGEFQKEYPVFQYGIIGTDISTRVLEKARLAVYGGDQVAPIPSTIKKQYLMVGKDRKKNLYRIVPELRKQISFRRLNFMDEEYPFDEQVHIIFCRNVIIYFDRQTQERLVNKFAHCLVPGGYLFMGHSETLHGLDIPFIQEAPTIYRRPYG